MTETRILIVEDEFLTAGYLKMVLQKFKYTVAAVCASGEESIVLAQTLQPHLVLMDITLQGEMDGIDAATEIRLYADVPIIFLTAHSDIATMERSLSVEPYSYLTKPFDEASLHMTIAMALLKHHSEKTLREKQVRYRSLFEYSPVAMFEENQARVKQIVDCLQEQGVEDLRQYFTENPAVIDKCLEEIKIIDMNQSALNLFEARDKHELQERLAQIFPGGRCQSLTEQIIALAGGKKEFIEEGPLLTLKNKPLHVMAHLHISPGFENDWGSVIISVIDMTYTNKLANALQEALRSSFQIAEKAQEINPSLQLLVRETENLWQRLKAEESIPPEVLNLAEQVYQQICQTAEISHLFEQNMREIDYRDALFPVSAEKPAE